MTIWDFPILLIVLLSWGGLMKLMFGQGAAKPRVKIYFMRDQK